MRAWFQKTLSRQSSLTAVLHSIRRLREQHAWFPLTKHERVEERSLHVAAKQRELPLPIELHTARMHPRSSTAEIFTYLKGFNRRRLIVYAVATAWILAFWIALWIADVENGNGITPRTDFTPERRVFNLTFAPVFLDESLAFDMAYQALSQLGYQVNKWNPVELVDKRRVKLPDDSEDVYLHRTALNVGFMMFTNAAGRERVVTFYLTNNIVSCEVHESVSKK